MTLKKWQTSTSFKKAEKEVQNNERKLVKLLTEKNEKSKELLNIANELQAETKPPRDSKKLLLIIDKIIKYIIDSINFIDEMYDYIDESEKFAISMFDYSEETKKLISKEAEMRESALEEVLSKYKESSKKVAEAILEWCRLAFPNQKEEEYTLYSLIDDLKRISDMKMMEMHSENMADNLEYNLTTLNLNKQLLQMQN